MPVICMSMQNYFITIGQFSKVCKYKVDLLVHYDVFVRFSVDHTIWRNVHLKKEN